MISSAIKSDTRRMRRGSLRERSVPIREGDVAIWIGVHEHGRWRIRYKAKRGRLRIREGNIVI